MSSGAEKAATAAVSVLVILDVAAALLGLALRAIDAGKRTVTREDVDAAFARMDKADAKWDAAGKKKE